MLYFITTKQLNKKQVKWSKILKQYKFKIEYNLGKNNGKVNILNKKNDYIETKDTFSQNILKINKDGSLLINNTHEVNVIIKILKDSKE